MDFAVEKELLTKVDIANKAARLAARGVHTAAQALGAAHREAINGAFEDGYGASNTFTRGVAGGLLETIFPYVEKASYQFTEMLALSLMQPSTKATAKQFVVAVKRLELAVQEYKDLKNPPPAPVEEKPAKPTFRLV